MLIAEDCPNTAIPMANITAAPTAAGASQPHLNPGVVSITVLPLRLRCCELMWSWRSRYCSPASGGVVFGGLRGCVACYLGSGAFKRVGNQINLLKDAPNETANAP